MWQEHQSEIGEYSLIFVSRISPDTTSDILESFLGEKGINNIECTELKTRFNTYKSYKIGVPELFSDQILTPGFWPSGILVRPFIPSKRGSSNSFLGRTVYSSRKP